MKEQKWMMGCVALVGMVLTLVLAQSGLAAPPGIEVAGELFVDLDARHTSAGESVWVNNGTLADFIESGNPIVVDYEGAQGVQFNGIDDAYQCNEAAPDGLVGPDPTRSIEVWVLNPSIPPEETMVAWSWRDGNTAGSNMSFNYGNHNIWGAVGHMHQPGDLGWYRDGSTGAPEAGQWHHLVYTYDGTTTRVYADGVETNSEVLGAGVINTHGGTPITLASQMDDSFGTLTGGLKGSLTLARVRVHDGVLTPEQIDNNYLFERPDFPEVVPWPPQFVYTPGEQDAYASGATTYSIKLIVTGVPTPDLTVVEPAGATITPEGLLEYTLPVEEPASFTVTVRASNTEGTVDASWTVFQWTDVQDGIAWAENVYVDLDSRDSSAGTATWVNNGSLGDFIESGDPVVIERQRIPAVQFDGIDDAYQCAVNAPDGLVGLDPTRTIEVWALNPTIAAEETLVAWAQRDGPCGTNMSFNYGTNEAYGAVGHWCGQDIGWLRGRAGAPAANEWHHLVYTYDGTTTRVYADGVETNSEVLGAGAINTHCCTRIAVASQIVPGGALAGGLKGSLLIGRVRVHDGVLSPGLIYNNYQQEVADFTPPYEDPAFVDAPDSDTFNEGDAAYYRTLTVTGYPVPTLEAIEPAGATITPGGAYAYTIPATEPDSFTVTVRATNEYNDEVHQTDATWVVSRKPLVPGEIAVAGELFVDIVASADTTDTDTWINNGTLGDFIKSGNPVPVEHAGAWAVSFNGDITHDYYKCEDMAPAGLVGLSPTRSIEAWVFNPDISDEETILAWAKRGGPDGSNMSFNYGVNQYYGAVGHWGWAGPDMGWYPGATDAPPAGKWHHLVYTFDGSTTRVYADGVETNFEVLPVDTVNTWAGTPITLVGQLGGDGVTVDFALRGTLSIGKVRIHDGVLSPAAVLHNFNEETDDYPIPPEPPVFVNAPAEDSFYGGDPFYYAIIDVEGWPIPTVELIEPADATLTPTALLSYTVTYAIPDPPPDAFMVTLRATNAEGTVDATWEVKRIQAGGLRAGPVHRYSFEADANDSVGGAHGTLVGDVSFEGGQAVLNNWFAETSSGGGAYIDLPNGMISALGNEASFEAWVTWEGITATDWQRIFDFGTSTGGEDVSNDAVNQYYIFLSPSSGLNTLRCGYRDTLAVERVVEDDEPLAAAEEQHIVVSWNGGNTTAKLFLNGIRIATDPATHIVLSDIVDNNNWLGRSQWGPDLMFQGRYNEFRIYDYALDEKEVLGNFGAGPDEVNIASTGEARFIRMDLHPLDAPDGKLGLTDVIWFLASFLFGQDKELNCPDAADANDDGKIGLTDAIYMLSYLFLPEGRKPPAKPPFGPLPGGCGVDPTPDNLDETFSKTGECVYPSCPAE